MLIAGGVMVLVGGGVILIMVASRQFLKLKYKLKTRYSRSKIQARLRRQKMPVKVDGALIDIETSKYFEPVEFSCFDEDCFAEYYSNNSLRVF